MRGDGPAKSANRSCGKAERLKVVELTTHPVQERLVFGGVFFFGYFLLDKQKKVTVSTGLRCLHKKTRLLFGFFCELSKKYLIIVLQIFGYTTADRYEW